MTEDEIVKQDSDIERPTFFAGAASGQQRSALRRLDPDAVMISHATANNVPWEGDYELFVDSGGYHHMQAGAGEYAESDEEYLRYLLKHRPDLYALRDYPCEPDLLRSLGRTVEEQQERTLEHHIRLYDKVDGHSLADNAVSVVQGWTREQYLDHLDALRDHGVMTDYLAIGSVCRRNADEDIADVVLAVRDAIPASVKLHAFGVKGSVLRFREVVDALDSVDSAAYDWAESRVPKTRSDGESFSWRDSARSYLNWRHDLLRTMGSESLHDDRSTQTTLVATDGGNCSAGSDTERSADMEGSE
ncbi:hypothetical protein GCM10009037_06890 [Halarchaeum grantii]|uniref:DeoxyPurine in DNA protein A domain-containing protein n=1 Tax=Halarchaeum grantii TaxID=1193105 RepID=A0A830FA29_9EURY|nr:hypothetical protein [Halarchaeum grantii]GGL25888.1 hypothetical protein GCM10009037_06890 [Halarchaeum grantii]